MKGTVLGRTDLPRPHATPQLEAKRRVRVRAVWATSHPPRHTLRVGGRQSMCALRRGNDYPLAVYFRSGLNDSSDRVRLRDKYSMACAHFGDLGARTLLHPALKLGAYYVILGGQDGVAGLGAPCRHGDGRPHGLLSKLLLRVRHELSFRRRDVRGVGFPKLRCRDEEILVRRGPIRGRPHSIVGRGEL